MTHPAYAHLDPRDDDMAKLIAIFERRFQATSLVHELQQLQADRIAKFDANMAVLDRIADGK